MTPRWPPLTPPGPIRDSLEVSRSNPRYFASASADGLGERVVYLTGSHVNNNFHDGLRIGAAHDAEEFDFDAYLRFLRERGHNFIRLWRWEQFKGYLAPANVHLDMTPQPWLRSGPGLAADGKPRFDLEVFDAAYFERLRQRVSAACAEGIYVSVMLFEGFSLHLTAAPWHVEGHPFHARNNVNGIGIRSVDDCQVLPLDARIRAVQEAYIERVIDTVHDLPNVLYEVSNESPGGGAVDRRFADQLKLDDMTVWGDSTAWQYWVIDYVKAYEAHRAYQPHPVGMTMQYPVRDPRQVNAPLFASAADWISPGFDDADVTTTGGPHGGRWLTDPPANNGAKVILSDTDHYSPFSSSALWAWKSFLRGHQPLLYDLALVGGVAPPVPPPGVPAFQALEPARLAMGDTRRLAERVPLARMTPRGDLTTTGYALVSPGECYVVLQPTDGGDGFEVTVTAGTYEVEWFGIAGRDTLQGERVVLATEQALTFEPPRLAAGLCALLLRSVGRR